MNKHSILKAVLLSTALLLVSGCASHRADDYSQREARRPMSVQFGVIESVRLVTVEGSRSGGGAMAGAVAGTVIGSTVGGHRHRGYYGHYHHGSLAGALVGGIVGGLAGAAIEESATRREALEITVQLLDSGEYVAVVQADGGEDFQPGEQVRLVGNGSTLRVTR
ncbi:MAG: hypothetical protein LBV29_03470 [Azoarcus sp.]|jgi:outer membrane lipoprotein SlyB|nr:hypothetical protein [Azoarcus sp.]